MRMRLYTISVLLVTVLTQDAETVRFLDDDTAGPALDEGEKVTVLFREGDLVRVRKGERYGWVASSVLTDAAPEAAAPTEAIPATAPAEFDLQKLQELLQRTGDM
ncbi:MAG: hypothetical protein JRI25_14160 [Deltaproteobacteria bacterium]|nr:hypothetical protein [Deltaproteobacteria bacterium]